MAYNPVYRLFMGMKQAYFEGTAGSRLSLLGSASAVGGLFALALYAWNAEMKKEE